MLVWVLGRVGIAKGENGRFWEEPRRGRVSGRTSHNGNIGCLAPISPR